MGKVVLFDYALAGGTGNFILTLGKILSQKGFEIHIVTFEDHIDYAISEEFTRHLLPKERKKSSILRSLRKILSQIGDFDVIFSNSTPSNKILSLLKLPNSYHIVHSSEDKVYEGPLSYIRRSWRRRGQEKLYSGKHIITVSQGLQKYITEELRAKPLSIRTIYNPFDFDEIHSMSLEPSPAIPDTPYIIHVARLDISHKRHDLLLQAYKKADLPHKLVILGQGEDASTIRELIERLNLNDRVLMPGFASNPYPWIRRADLLVLSSDFEGFGRVLVEALALQTPVVSTDCKVGPAEILTGELSRFLVPVGDVNALSHAMRQALEHYPPLEDLDLSRFESREVANAFSRLPHLRNRKTQG